MNEFKSYHPLVNLIFFVFTTGFAMFFMHPVCLVIALITSFINTIITNGKKGLKFTFYFLLPVVVFSAVLNPLFNHGGETILGYLPSGNPFTMESVLYGIAASFMLVSVIFWFSCVNNVFTSDKFIYLFGKIIPSLSLIFSMVLQFIPRFKVQLKICTNAQKGIGEDITSGSIIKRIKNGILVLSIMISWSLENAVDTADSMKSRGYGLKNRTAYSNYIFDKRDRAATSIIMILGLYVLIGAINRAVNYTYFPKLEGKSLNSYTISIYLAYFLLCIIPVIIELWEAKKWKALKSKI